MEYYGLDSRPDQDEIQLLYPTQKLLKAKYRELVRIHHPDKKGETAEFQRIDSSYRELNRLYDEKTGNFKYKPKKKTDANKTGTKNKSSAGGAGTTAAGNAKNAAAAGTAKPATAGTTTGGAAKPKAGTTTGTPASGPGAAGAASSSANRTTNQPKQEVPPGFDPFESAVPPNFDPFEDFSRGGQRTGNNQRPNAAGRGSSTQQGQQNSNFNNRPGSFNNNGNYPQRTTTNSSSSPDWHSATSRGNSPMAPPAGARRGDFPETQRNYDADSSTSESGFSDEENEDQYYEEEDNNKTKFSVLEVIVMGFRNLEKAGTFKIEVALDGRSQQMMTWTELHQPRALVYCDRVENFTFFHWHTDSYLQVILHGQRTFRMNKREGESHVSVKEVLRNFRGKFEGWVTLEHKNKKIGEVLLGINMEGEDQGISARNSRPELTSVQSGTNMASSRLNQSQQYNASNRATMPAQGSTTSSLSRPTPPPSTYSPQYEYARPRTTMMHNEVEDFFRNSSGTKSTPSSPQYRRGSTHDTVSGGTTSPPMMSNSQLLFQPAPRNNPMAVYATPPSSPPMHTAIMYNSGTTPAQQHQIPTQLYGGYTQQPQRMAYGNPNPGNATGGYPPQMQQQASSPTIYAAAQQPNMMNASSTTSYMPYGYAGAGGVAGGARGGLNEHGDRRILMSSK
ncbi:unnamed protein product [Amoebophrya sp. A120]|nr:unnamed protein product [Amoebophrya sp. A120]|eukprot:GSA120T00020117001.1